MTKRAETRPELRRRNLLPALAMLAAAALVGCGGGGGGGNNGGGGGGGGTDVCGSAAGSTVSVICGNVKVDGTSTGVAGATVTLKSSTGASLSTTTTDGAGFFKFNTVPAGAALYQVDPPPTGFNPQTCRAGGGIYAYYITNQAGTGACIPSLNGVVAGDKNLGTIGLFPDSAPPPPPVGCPR